MGHGGHGRSRAKLLPKPTVHSKQDANATEIQMRIQNREIRRGFQDALYW